jgi:hypothetical protein
MWRALTRHPDTPCDAVASIEVSAERPAPAQLVLRYRLSGITDGLVMPPAANGRADELWRHTCLEAFVRPMPGDAYAELNLSPGGQWAACHFDDYRHDMTNLDVPEPDVEIAPPDAGALTFAAVWELDRRPLAPWRLGMSAVVEERSGRISYWALAHPPGRPDFHNADCFILELPAPEGP